MGQNVQLNVILPKNRNHTGWLRVEVDGVPKAEFRVLGRGSSTVGGVSTGNPTRNPFFYAGNTPTGTYRSPGIEDTSGWNQASYGPWGAVQLTAVGGDALLADQAGRKGLLIHGGNPGQFDGYRSTLGCLRVSNGDMFALRQLLFSAGDDSGRRMSHQITVGVTVRDW